MKCVNVHAYAAAFSIGPKVVRHTVVFSQTPPDLAKINHNNGTKYTGLVCKQITDPAILAQLQTRVFEMILGNVF